jgi:hypothetical protein
MRDQVSKPHKRTGKTIIPYVLIFLVLERQMEDRRK